MLWLPVSTDLKVTVTSRDLLIDTKRGNAHHYTDYQTDEHCRGQKKGRPAGEKKRQRGTVPKAVLDQLSECYKQ